MKYLIILLLFTSCTNHEYTHVPAVVLDVEDKAYILRHPNAVNKRLTYRYPKSLTNYCVGDTIYLKVRKSVASYYGK